MSNSSWGGMGGRNVAGTKESWLCRCGSRNIGTRFCGNCPLAIDENGRIVNSAVIEVVPNRGYAPLVLGALVGSVVIAIVAYLLIGDAEPERGPRTTLTTTTAVPTGSVPAETTVVPPAP